MKPVICLTVVVSLSNQLYCGIYIKSSCYIKRMELISLQISNFKLTENFKNLIHRYYACFRPSLLYNHGSLGYSSNKNTACIPFVPFTVFSYYLIHITLLVTTRTCRRPTISSSQARILVFFLLILLRRETRSLADLFRNKNVEGQIVWTQGSVWVSFQVRGPRTAILPSSPNHLCPVPFL
ncbi:hypothetical protein KDRO_F04050 [Kluyveromyces lactis]|nr:hypothetical protein KDRO_F04050 [Kluyveromyces lactis]